MSSVLPRAARSAASLTSARAPEVGLGGLVEERDRLGRLLLAQADLARVGGRAQRLGQDGSGLARRRSGEPGQDGGELEKLQIVLAHTASVRRFRPLHGPRRRRTIRACRTATRCHS